MNRLLFLFRMTLGGVVCGSFLGILLGALVGLVGGAFVKNVSIALDGALIGGLVIGILGGIFGLIMGSWDAHFSSPRVSAEQPTAAVFTKSSAGQDKLPNSSVPRFSKPVTG